MQQAMDTSDAAELVALPSDAPVSSDARVLKLGRLLQDAGWEIICLDIDWRDELPRLEAQIVRNDGYWLFARLDQLGRGTVERFWRSRDLRVPANVKGCQPLSPAVNDEFLGRTSGLRGLLPLLVALADTVAANSSHPRISQEIRVTLLGLARPAPAALPPQDAKA